MLKLAPWRGASRRWSYYSDDGAHCAGHRPPGSQGSNIYNVLQNRVSWRPQLHCLSIYLYIIIISFVRKLYYSNMDKSYFHDYTYLMSNDRAQALALTHFSKVLWLGSAAVAWTALLSGQKDAKWMGRGLYRESGIVEPPQSLQPATFLDRTLQPLRRKSATVAPLCCLATSRNCDR